MRMRPEDFWSLSLREWLLAADGYAKSKGAGGPSKYMTRAELAKLEADYPDEPVAVAKARVAAEKRARAAKAPAPAL